MDMIRPTAILAEDEAPQLAQLRALISELWPELHIVAECTDGKQAIAALKRYRPDVAFLDIRMPGADGLQVAAAEPGSHMVFITAYDEFAVRAFEEGAADYLLKPLKRDRLAITVERLKSRLESGNRVDLSVLLSRLEGRLSPTPHIKWITASMGGAVKMLAVDEVQFFQSQDKYTRVATATEEAHIRMPLKDLIAQLDPGVFCQVHRGAVVRLSAVRMVRRDDDGKQRIHLHGRVETLPVSPVFAARFKSM